MIASNHPRIVSPLTRIVPRMIRDGRKDSRIITLREMYMRLWTMNGMKVSLNLGDRGQKIWLSDRHAEMDTFCLLWCYRRIMIVHVDTFRIAELGARARYI